MVLRMKNFNVLRVLWKIRLLMMRRGGGVHKKNNRGRRLPKKGEGLGLFADLRREPWQEIGRGLARNRGCFWGGLRPQSHYGGAIGWHTHINIYLHHQSCAYSSYVYYTEWITCWYQKSTFLNGFAIEKLLTCGSHIYLLDSLRVSSC